MKTARDRLVRKMTAQTSELSETSNRDIHRECGDLITTNMHNMKKGQQVLIADDFFSDKNTQREIKLDAMKTPQQNAAKYYKAYTKAKNAVTYLTEQLKKGETELTYIESVIEQLQRVESEQELSEIRNELSLTGYVKAQKLHKQKQKQTESAPLCFKSSTGMQILVGRNNIQNDKLTLKLADRTNMWLHAQKIHGAHVIIRASIDEVDESTLHEAAVIAAYYSSARSDTKVPVDYTQVKYVKKPSGGRPGAVIYTDYKTIIATPDEELINKLRD